LYKRLTPTFARLKIPNNSPAAKTTVIKAQTLRIKQEIRFLHIKKQKLNSRLYHLHLHLADTWGNSWHYISDTIEAKLETLMKGKYQKLERKLLNLSQNQVKTTAEHCTFYPRVINNTDITFSDNEITLLNKGLKYILHQKKRHWLTDIALKLKQPLTHCPLQIDHTTENKSLTA
jgi:hypothetical protein